MNPLKVLMLLHDLSRTGAPKVALDLAEALGDRVQMRLVAPEEGPLAARCRLLGPLLLPFAELPHGKLAWRLESRRRKRRWGEVRNWKPDLIYANSVMSLPLAERLERTLGLPEAPILLHVHELDSVVARVKSSFADWLIRRPACYVGVSHAVCRRLVDFAGVEAKRVRHIPAFVRESEFKAFAPAASHKAVSGGIESRVIVGGAGTPSWTKNTTLWLLVAADFVNDDRVQFRWVGVPDGPAGESFRIKRKLLGLEDQVDLLGVTDRPLEAFAAFDIFLLTSWEDSFPLVVLENMMLEKPVVCLPGGGAPDEVGEAGVVVGSFDPRAVAQALRGLIADPQRRKHLGAAARQRVLDNFTDRVCVPQLWDAMQQTAAATRA